ncbi:hypothetical protein [Novosphingobium sp. B1]|uniref:hypothetical protein n=1 Tax=Novosphingobium sp. B1 TaxID=1938756 RepID=UPI0009D82EC4|nr:hypothetical protein [Novosphingobium sp. B1]SMC45574.1 hypothetical protein SAMN06272759_1039 [Novosphingobium sp. B1]
MSEEWPVWEVGLYGFGDIYVEAPTKASARWFAASACHDAGYGRSPIDLIRRGVSIGKIDRTTAAIFGDIHRVKRLRPSEVSQ